MRCHTALLSAIITLTLGAGLGAHDRDINAQHVRGLNPASISAIADAQQRSATVRALTSTLEASDLVAYVNITTLAKGSVESGLSYVGASAAQRFVLITISEGAAADRQIELLGHELQHATDVAKAAWVTDDNHVQTLMTTVGWRDGSRARGYETTAAVSAEHHVHQELRKATGTAR
jgi:hypothetical protein